MKIKILKLIPNSRFHFGKPLIDSDTSLTDTDKYLHSDVLFAALVSNLATVKDSNEVSDFVKAFEEGKMKISSAFYCLENADDSFTLLLPKPADVVNKIDINDYDKIKQFKKIQFVSHDLISKDISEWIIDGNVAFSKPVLEKLQLKHRNQNEKAKVPEIFGEYSDGNENRFRLFSKGLNTQVGIRSVKNETIIIDSKEEDIIVSKGPYQVSYIQIADLSALKLKVHFYFAYEISDSQYEYNFELAVKLLEYNGVGGERSSGYGKIEKIDSLNKIPELFMSSEKCNRYLSLSKIIPQNEQELKKIEAYTHCIRGGRQTHDLGLLKSIRMINEGAILTHPIEGNIVDISPDSSKKYFRSGKALLIPIPQQKNS